VNLQSVIFTIISMIARERTMRTFSKPVNLKQFDKRNWMTSEEGSGLSPNTYATFPHTKILSGKKMEKSLSRIDKRSYLAELGFVEFK